MSDLESQIKRVIEGYKAAVLAKDVDAFIGLYGQKVRVFDTWGAWSYEGVAAWRQVVQRWFASLGEELVAVSAADLQVAGGQNLAMASAIVTYAAIASTGETLRAMQNRLTWALAREGDNWKVVHEHTSAPVGDDLRAILHREK